MDRWIKQAQTSGSFSEKDNRSPEENELIALRKENQRLKMENDILKQAATKVSVIKRNRDKYSVSAMCAVLQISKSTYYYEACERPNEDALTALIVEIFEKNRKAYGTRKMKAKLHERGVTVSRRRIGRIMKEQELVSTYTVAQFKPHKLACNESKQSNELNREFQQSEAKRVTVSDLRT